MTARHKLLDQRRARLGNLVQGASCDIPPLIIGIAQLLNQGAHGCRRAEVSQLAQGKLLHGSVRALQQTGEPRPGVFRKGMRIE